MPNFSLIRDKLSLGQIAVFTRRSIWHEMIRSWHRWQLQGKDFDSPHLAENLYDDLRKVLSFFYNNGAFVNYSLKIRRETKMDLFVYMRAYITLHLTLDLKYPFTCEVSSNGTAAKVAELMP